MAKRTLYSIRFDRSYKQFNAGEVAGFSLEEATKIVANNAGVHLVAGKPARLPGVPAPVDPAIAEAAAKLEAEKKAKAGAERKAKREAEAKLEAEKKAKAGAAKPAAAKPRAGK